MEISYAIVILVLLGAMAATVPVFLCLFFTAVAGFLLFTDLPLLVLAQSLFRSMDNFALVVVLFFILCGNIMTSGSIVTKLIRFANVVVGWLPGGLAMAGILACGLFGAISGSTVATVVAIGGFMIPALITNKYDLRFSVGVMTTAPNLGVIIPPSISMILYSMISAVSLEGLFLTGFLPGILIMAGMCAYSYIWAVRHPGFIQAPKPTWNEAWAAFKDGFWALMLPVIIFGGIFSGAFTANEAAVVACVYAFAVELFIHKGMKYATVKKVMINSAVTSATLLIIVAGATCFGRYLTFEAIPAKISEAVVASIKEPWMFLMVINVLLLIIGMFMDIISATLILGPIFLPMLSYYGVNPVHFGLLMTVNLAIGYCTPPLGVSLYITGAMVNKDLVYVSRAVLPWVTIQIAVLMLLTYWPDAVLWLPRLVGWNVD
ncbi:MAG: TRAP transporter large permease [Desulfarculus sp.]|jgi:C4-dicarboxylate transporter DctM subunit|nr:MAG: TRAP transporter large permease [Desulfarculus sp.]